MTTVNDLNSDATGGRTLSWFSAHILMMFKLLDGPQTSYHFWENVILFQADSVDEAWRMAKTYGLEDESYDETMTWGGRPSSIVFAGVRKVSAFENPLEQPDEGTLISSTVYSLQSEDDLRLLVEDKGVELIYWGGD